MNVLMKQSLRYKYEKNLNLIEKQESMPFAWYFYLKHLALSFLSKPFNLWLKDLWKKWDRSKRNVWAREVYNLEKLIDLVCKMVLRAESRDDVGKVVEGAKKKWARFVRLDRSRERERKRKRRAVITQEIKMSRILHEAPVRNSTVSRTPRKMCRSFLSREYSTLCV